jgi:hypothetical protein
MRNTQITAIFLQYGGDIQALQYDVSSKIIRHFEWRTHLIIATTTQLWSIVTLQSSQTKATAAVSDTVLL